MKDVIVSMYNFISHFSEHSTIYYAFSSITTFTGHIKIAVNSINGGQTGPSRRLDRPRLEKRSDRPCTAVRPAGVDRGGRKGEEGNLDGDSNLFSRI